MNEKKVLIACGLFTLLVVGGGVFFLGKQPAAVQVNSSQNAKASVVEEKNYDWGQIPYSGGKVSKSFTIKNTGTDKLTLSNIQTSCMCTNASVIIDGKSSPEFGMHSTSSWVGEVMPGKDAQLLVVFDPAFHGPSGVGIIDRLVEVGTNDSNNAKLEFHLKGNVVK